ncbi:uncharacterized protein [Epargyreus clarus]|uniref:uncharacterized protein n=1 Tax=Epargyreus clarus TaxID=520877 RepID=UPI003C2B67A1
MGDKGDYRKEKKSVKTSIDGRVVAFKSRVQVIPANSSYILSPARYLLESQKYYNELFSPRFYAPHMFPVIRANQKQKTPQNRISKNHKTKKIEERRSSGYKLNSRRFNISTSRSDEKSSVSR